MINEVWNDRRLRHRCLDVVSLSLSFSLYCCPTLAIFCDVVVVVDF